MLRVRVLGSLTVERDGAPVALPAGARVRGLLAWLALHPGPRPRAVVAARLWPDVLDASARASLRTAVWELRRALGDADGAILRTTRDDLELAAGWVDLDAFTAATDPDEALALVRGELLAGLEEEWVLAARDEQRERTMTALAGSADAAEARGDLAAAIAADRRRTQLDPFAEAAHRDLIRRLAATGDRPGALRAYATLRDRMRRELGLSPGPETRAAMEAVRADAEPAAEPAATRRPRRAHPPLQGRTRELAALTAALHRAEAGAGGAAQLTGEGGIGKTRLATELLEHAEERGARTARAAGLELGGAPPFGLWAELLGDLARGLPATARPPEDAVWPQDVARLSPVASQRLGDAARVAAGAPDFERARLFEGVAEMLAWCAAASPLVLLVEDIHLADTASLELAAYVARRLTELRVLLVLTRRTLPASAAADQLRHALTARGALLADLELGPLAPPELTTLVRTVAPLGRAEVDRLVAASDGNALLAVEAARAAHAGTPATGLRSLVAAATARLQPPAREITELTAAAGRELSRAEVAKLPADDVAGALESDLLDGPGGRLGFRHQLLRAAVYDALPAHRRAALHGRLADLLDAPAAERGRHLLLAGRDDEAAEELERAGIAARRLGALTEAEAFLREALALAPGDPRILLELGDVAAWANRWEDAEAAVAAALEALDPADAVGRARVHARRGLWLCSSLCAPRPAAAAYGEALRLLDGHPEAPRAALLEAIAGLAWAEGAGGDPDRADALLARLDDLADDVPDTVAGTAASARGMALCRRGRFAEVDEPMRRAAAAHARAGAPDAASVALANAACAAAFEHDWDRALALADRAGEYGRGVVRLEAHARAARAYVYSRLGRHDEAIAAAREQLAAAERAGGPELIATAEHDLGAVLLAAGDHEQAAERLGRALAAPGAPFPRAQARLSRAEALARLGRAAEAEEEVRAATFEPVGPGDLPAALVPRMARVQALIAAARGDDELAGARFREAADGWRARLAAPGGAGFIVDLGRPPVAGLVEPDRELARVERELAALHADDSAARA